MIVALAGDGSASTALLIMIVTSLTRAGGVAAANEAPHALVLRCHRYVECGRSEPVRVTVMWPDRIELLNLK